MTTANAIKVRPGKTFEHTCAYGHVTLYEVISVNDGGKITAVDAETKCHDYEIYSVELDDHFFNPKNTIEVKTESCWCGCCLQHLK